MAAFIVMALIGAPAVLFARARGGSDGGYTSGSWNDAKVIQQLAAPQPALTARPTPARQPSFLQRPLLAGLAVGVAGSWIGSMLFGATDSSAQTNDAGEPAAVLDTTAEDSDSAWILLLLLLLGAGAIFYFLKVQRPSLPDFSGITGRDPSSDNLPTRRSSTTRQKISADPVEGQAQGERQ